MNTVSRILRKHRKKIDEKSDPIVEYFKLDESNEDEDGVLPPPPFEATLISPPESRVHVYLGNVSDAMYPDALSRLNIIGVINMAARQCTDVQRMQRVAGGHEPSVSQWDRVEFNQRWYRSHLGEGFSYLAIPAEDHPRYKITDDFKECFEFLARIEESAQDGRRPAVLVHCMQGLNRSAAVCVGWLVERWGLTVPAAVESIASARSGILSNRGFVKQIVHWQWLKALPEPRLDVRPKQPPKIVHIGNIVERM